MKVVSTAVVVASLPLLALAGPVKAKMPVPQASQQVAAAKTETPSSVEFTLNGVTAANRADIEKIARSSGADRASLNIKSGVLRIRPGKSFNKDEFMKSLQEKVPTVSLKT